MRQALPAVIAALALALAGCGEDDNETGTAGPTSASGTTVPTTTPTEEPAVRTPGGCEQVDAPGTPEPTEEPKEPKQPLDASKEYSLVFKTNCGDFTVDLDLETGPKASASLVSLARIQYFDGTVFHRISTGLGIIQGGDPTASGGGGPGYTTVDPPPQSARYTKGVFAMAKTPTEPPGAGGSQFFVVTTDDTGLPPEYAVVGKVSDGLDVVEKIGRLGDQSEQPTETVLIETVEVVEQ